MSEMEGVVDAQVLMDLLKMLEKQVELSGIEILVGDDDVIDGVEISYGSDGGVACVSLRIEE